MSSMFSASRRKSSSSITVSANSSTRAGGLARAVTGIRPIRRGASHESAAMSSRKSCATRGRCTLTTTSSPVMRRAACTCAIEAAAIGISSKEREQLLERASEVDLDDGPDVLERLGRHPVAELLELGDHLVGKEPFAARDDLAELHVARAEVTEGFPQATGDPGTGLRPPVLEDEPARERAGDLGDGAGEAAERREPARRQQPRHLLAGAPTEAVDLPAPGDLVGIEDPRAAIAERAEFEVRREVRRFVRGGHVTSQVTGRYLGARDPARAAHAGRFRFARSSPRVRGLLLAAAAPRPGTLLGVERRRHRVLICGRCRRRIHADEIGSTNGIGDRAPGTRHELVRAGGARALGVVHGVVATTLPLSHAREEVTVTCEVLPPRGRSRVTLADDGGSSLSTLPRRRPRRGRHLISRA